MGVRARGPRRTGGFMFSLTLERTTLSRRLTRARAAGRYNAWLSKTQECIATDQKAVVVYKGCHRDCGEWCETPCPNVCPADCRGHCGDGSSKGLGNSQKGEVAWLQEQGVPIAHYGIEQFEALVKGAREQGDGAAAYWDQARLPSPLGCERNATIPEGSCTAGV